MLNAFQDLIFIVGPRKVGKTLLSSALGEHPLILSRNREAPLMSLIGQVIFSMDSGGVGNRGTFDPQGYFERAISVRKEYLYKTFRRLCFESVFGSHYGVRRFMLILTHGDLSLLRKRYWCTETTPTQNESEGLLKLYPRARFIHMVRNGIDAVQARIHAVRTRKRGALQLNFNVPCETWANDVNKYSYMSRIEPVFQARFEELTSQPHYFFQKVFEFTGLDHHPGPVDLVKKPLGDVDANDVLGRSVWQTWTPEQRETFGNICGDSMRELGYEFPP